MKFKAKNWTFITNITGRLSVKERNRVF